MRRMRARLSARFASAARSTALLPILAPNDPRPGVVDTIYLGGGTPSLLDPADLAAIIGSGARKFRCQWRRGDARGRSGNDHARRRPRRGSLPGSIASAWARSRFTIRSLIAAGRMHRRADIFRAVEVLRAAGFANISLDLIAGLPHQTEESWRESLAKLLRLRPEHISIYLLEIDEGSRLGRESLAGGSRYGAAAIPDDDAMATFYEQACSELGRRPATSTTRFRTGRCRVFARGTI